MFLSEDTWFISTGGYSMIQPPEYIRDIQPYVPGKPIEELERELGISESIKLASNENPIGPSPAAINAIRNPSEINRYPDGGGYYLTKALSQMLGIGQDEIILGNGSNEVIDIAVKTYLQDGDEAVMAVPSFVVYAMAVKAVGAKAVQIPLRDYTHDLAAMADAITPKTKIVFIANPNNPTGTLNKQEEFDALMNRIPDTVLVVIDEAYYEYVTEPEYADSMKHFRGEKNILILRTFSKIYGLAGLRIGYGIGKKELLSDMNRVREPFNTNSIAQTAAHAALTDNDHISRSRTCNEEGKKYLYDEFRKLGMEFVPTEANFIYIPVNDALILHKRLLEQGVIIRPMGPNAIRATIGLPEENRRFIEALKKILEGKD
jgi:histidinol-phosphate aminotransferase